MASGSTEGTAAGPDERRAELAASLDDLRARIVQASVQAGRNATDVVLIAVTKTFPLTDVRLLLELGVDDLGENRDQEAKAKAAQLASTDVRWHFLGQVQTNKARSVAAYAQCVHSVDRASLVDALQLALTRSGRDRLDVFIQVNLDGTSGRGGAAPGLVAGLADQIAGTAALRLRGVMTVAPLGAEPARAFGQLAEISQRLRHDHQAATDISAGMSGDFVSAIAAGATHLRIGSALLGPRGQVVS